MSRVGGRDVQPTSEEPKDRGVGPGVTDIKQRGGTRQKGVGKMDSGKEGRDEGAVAGMTQDESRRPRPPGCSIHWCAAALHAGPALSPPGFPARGWGWFSEGGQLLLALLMAWGPGLNMSRLYKSMIPLGKSQNKLEILERKHVSCLKRRCLIFSLFSAKLPSLQTKWKVTSALAPGEGRWPFPKLISRALITVWGCEFSTLNKTKIF